MSTLAGLWRPCFTDHLHAEADSITIAHASENSNASEPAGVVWLYHCLSGWQDARRLAGLAAVGWRLSVWWSDDARFYSGTAQEYNPESGRYLCCSWKILCLSRTVFLWGK